MTEKMLIETLSINTNKQNKHAYHAGYFYAPHFPNFHPSNQ